MMKLIVFATGFLLAGSAQAEILHHWTQMIDGEAQSFRAIVSDEACPTMRIDGVAAAMQIRAEANDDFPNLACELVTDATVASAELDDLRFPLKPENVERIVILGDTGCRLKKGDPIQACADPVAWPFATIANSVAATEADLAIHAGDLHYREMKCPDPAVCGTLFGDNWATWQADFFAPAQTMLTAHPFVIARGDHEVCKRAWIGYLRYLAPHTIRTPLMCDNFYDSYVVDFEDLQLAVLDSSTRSRSHYTWDRLREMRGQFVTALPHLDRETYVVTHAPIWGYGRTKPKATDFGTLETIQREAFATMMPRLVSAVISGDLHFAQIVNADGNPTQITIGNSGVELYSTPEGHSNEVAVGKGVTGSVYGYNDFGFGVIERGADGGSLTLHDKNGKVVATCSVAEGAGSCVAE
jgi:hypothetical protein